MSLTAKQARFVEEYLIDLNATQAAIRAGYAEGSAKVTASRMLTNDNVAAAVAEAKARRSERADISQDSILRELAKLGFSNMLDYMEVQDDGLAVVDLSELTRDQAAAISEATIEDMTVEGKRVGNKVKIKLVDKKGTLELLGRHVGLKFASRHEVTGKDGGPVAVTMAGILEEIDGKTRGLPGDHEQTE